MTINNRTPNLDLPLPHADNELQADIQRLRDAFTALDTAVNDKSDPADIAAAIAAVIGAAPSGLNTLAELAGSIANDINFAGTVNTALATKAVASTVAASFEGVTSSLSGKSNTGHGHLISEITGLASALAAKLESVPMASVGTLGGVKIGDGLVIDESGILSVPSAGGGIQTFTVLDITPTAGQTTFAISGGYVVGQIEVILNGTELMADDYTATNGTSVVLAVGAAVTDTLRVRKWAQFVSAGFYTKAESDSGAQALENKVISGASNSITVDGTNAVGFRHIPQVSQSAAYTLVLTDAGKHILHPSADTTARIFTIPANASVAFPIGTAVTFVNQNAAGVMTISITTDTMRFAGPGTTGSRTLAANGVATAIKISQTEWIISGVNLA